MKVSFDPTARLIAVTEAPVGGFGRLDAQVDLYSDAKAHWLADTAAQRHVFPFLTIGGQDLGGGVKAGSYYFLRNDLGWRIRPFGADHELIVTGNLFGADPNRPVFVQATGFTVAVRLNTSSLTQQVGSGLDAAQDGRLALVAKLLLNKTVTDPATGTITVYDDDDATVLRSANLFEDAAGSQPYRGQGAERRERLV